MKLTTKGRFAVAAVLDLALHGKKDKPVQLRDISLRQRISLSYLEQIFFVLKRSGLVRSMRGPGGGYLLDRPPEEITVAEVIASSGEKRQMMLCGGAENCSDSNKCITHDLWRGLDDCIREYLGRRTLSDLVVDAGVVSIAKRQQEEFLRLASGAAGRGEFMMLEPS
jgi:Rrf2 family iron-sulfur cluster assembly transcriptional regulator